MMKTQIEQIIDYKSFGVTEYARQLDDQINSNGKHYGLIKNYNDSLSKESIQLYHFSNATRSVLLPLFKSKSNKNLVLIHDLMPRSRIKKQFASFFIHIIRNKAWRIIVHTEAAKKLLINSYFRVNPDIVYVIPHGTKINDASDKSREQLRSLYHIRSHQKVLFMLGGISRKRGNKKFMKAFIKANKPDLHLIVSGKCKDKEAEILMRTSPNIQYIGFADNDLVNDYFKICDAVVVYRDSWVGESSSTIAYSLGHAKPVFASDTLSFREMIGNAGILFQNDETSMLNMLKLFVSGTIKMDILEQNAKLLREQYKWETYLKKLIIVSGINKIP